MNKQNLEQQFAKYGTIAEVVVVKDRETQRSRGFGFTFENQEDAKYALQGMNGKTMDGRQIRVVQAGKSERGVRGAYKGGSSGGCGFRGGRGRGGDSYGSSWFDSRSGGGYGGGNYGGSRDYSSSGRSQSGYEHSGGSYRDSYDS